MDTIYLDNAATSFPKPQAVGEAMKRYVDQVGATINRSVYGKAQSAGLVTLQLRERLKKLFHFPAPVTHVILTPGATWGLNMVIKGFLKPGAHCIVSSMEHNAVMRVLKELETNGLIRIRTLVPDSLGLVTQEGLRAAITPKTALCVLCHASNVTGIIRQHHFLALA